ncbi:magnesium transporter CorA [Actinomyces radicidentis]|uniref:Magnesium transporter CorA n=1 Tax=Actinomyces radicidentis TaxID=111015 RepID=A0A109W2W3_ACTRD|nr:magnesium transporter CorA family protein [Actinomyces radicidentis]AMD87736.1 magnesium transporter CorA [Actinomyces radicidentis]
MTFRALAWRDGVPTDAPTDISGVSEALADPDVLLWADLVHPSKDDLAVLADELGVDRNAIEDAVAPHERPKAQQLDDYTYFVTYATLRMFATTDGDEEDELSKVAGFAFPGGLVTVRTTDALNMASVLSQIKANRDLLRLGTPTLVHALLDVIVDGYFDTVQKLDDAIEALEDDLFSPSSHSTAFQRQAYDVRTKLVTLRRVVLPMREVINVIWRHRPEEVRELDPYYADLTDHMLRAAEWTESLRDMVTSVFETHLSLQDQRLNNVMKKLAGWAAVISIPTLVTGWFGQNVPYPGNGTRTGLVLSTLLVIVPAAIVYAIMKRNGWI